jgi:hypothetical protein
MAIVVFDPAAFIAEYPEFTSVSTGRLTAMFILAEQAILDNTDNSPVMDVDFRTQLFYMLVAHLLTIFGANPTVPTNPPPGRISQATEGTVTASFEYVMPAGSAIAPWFLQTKYGAMYWTFTAPFRSLKYAFNGGSGIGFAIAYGSRPVVGFVPEGFVP